MTIPILPPPVEQPSRSGIPLSSGNVSSFDAGGPAVDIAAASGR